ncbi:MAG: hypothetical protein K2H41_11735 [Acetatifactor sp.]|nr:hypothetical protein [Acetatifactor sp.]
MPVKLQVSKKRILYTVCFFFFCLIDQRIKTTSGLDGWGETFRDLTGVIMAALILSHYHLNDFRKRKIPYLVWSLVCVIGGVVFLLKGQALVWFANDRAVLVLDIFLFGIILIHTFTDLILERKRPRLYRPFALVWLIMMVLMIVSRSEYLWPFCYLVMFGCFYLTDYTAAEREDLFQGMLDGIILGFFMLQGWCFAFRPYDAVRYVGVYSNCNLNALFYLAVLAAALTKLAYVYRRECSRWIRLYYWLGVGTVFGFLFMTISRTGWMAAAVLTLAGLLCLWRVLPRRNLFVSLFKNGLIIVLCFVLTFPLVFGAVRYLPPAFHHPVWFFGEWNENKVHSWDKWDSEKFVNLDRLMRSASSRVATILEPVLEKIAPGGEAKETPDNPAKTSENKTNQIEVSPLQQQLYDEALAAGFALDRADRGNALLVRKAIYRYYIHLLNFRGHPDSEQGFQIFPNQRIGHAHNIYLQYGVDFGIPVMLLFTVLIGWSAVSFVKEFVRKPSEHSAGCLLFLLIPAVFGLLEYCWGTGSLAVTLLFVIWQRVLCGDNT